MGTSQEVFEPGEVIFKEGEQGQYMYILRSGIVHIKKKVENGEKLLKKVEQPHDFFGEMSLLDERPRSATAIAETNTNVLKIDRESFENLIINNGKFALKIIKILSERIRNSNVEISELVSEDLFERVCRGIADYGKDNGDKIYTGEYKVNLEDLKFWMNSNMGISNQDVDTHIFKALKNKMIDYAPTSVKTKEDIVMSKTFINQNCSGN